MTTHFTDRRDAGRRLAAALATWAGRDDLTVLGLPRGGVPVAAEVAAALGGVLDAFVVRKLGVPGHRELAMGAIASGGVRVLNEAVVQGLGLGPETIDAVAAEESVEMARRERAYRGDREPAAVAGRTVVLCDDGLATGATMRAAVAAVRALGPAAIVVAAPVGSPRRSRTFAPSPTRWSASRRRSTSTPSGPTTVTSGRSATTTSARCSPPRDPATAARRVSLGRPRRPPRVSLGVPRAVVPTAAFPRGLSAARPDRRTHPVDCTHHAARPSGPAPASLATAAIDAYLAHRPRDFLAVATPGAGKTTFALRVAAELLDARRGRRRSPSSRRPST